MSDRPEMEVCPNCGAPLDLDPDGKCQWCHARITVPVSSASAYRSIEPSLIPDDLDDSAVAPFIYLTLATLELLAHEPAVEQYARTAPAAQAAIRALCSAVSAAGVRVRDSGQMRDSFDERLGLFTAEEIWTADLAFDVIAMLGALPGVQPGTRASIIDDLKSLNQDARSLHWKRALHKAGDGPPDFRELRAHVPHRS